MIAIPAIYGASLFLSFAGFGVEIAMVLAFALVLSEESLPFVACFVFVLCYLWSS